MSSAPRIGGGGPPGASGVTSHTTAPRSGRNSRSVRMGYGSRMQDGNPRRPSPSDRWETLRGALSCLQVRPMFQRTRTLGGPVRRQTNPQWRAPTVGCRRADRVRRRDLFELFGGAVALWPLAGIAQPQKVPTIGVLVVGSPGSEQFWRLFREVMQELGYDEGQSIRYEFRSDQGQVDRLTELAAELAPRPMSDTGRVPGGSAHPMNG